MVIDKAQVRRILVITLSNVGDIILTTPVIRTLAQEFPTARIDCLVGPRGKEIFEKDPRIFKLIIYDKHLPIIEKRRLQLKLKRLRYDLVVDLRNTIFPILLGPKYRTSSIEKFPKTVVHRKDRHLYRLRSLGIERLVTAAHIHIPAEDEAQVAALLHETGIGEKFVVINPGAKSHLKRWTVDSFARLADRLYTECGIRPVFVGLHEDAEIVAQVIARMKGRSHNLVNKTNLRQLASLLKKSALVITNDSAPLHLACAVGAKVLAIFGPTDAKKYGPTGEFDAAIQKKLFCSPCEKAQCAYNHECMTLISADEVFEAAEMMIEGYE